MPLPTPRKRERKVHFIERCMGDPTMLRDFPHQDQRDAVCQRQWTGRLEAMIARLAELLRRW